MPRASAASKARAKPAPDPELPITRQITELRDGYNSGNVERVLAVYADAFTDMTAGEPSWFGSTAKERLRTRLTDLFAHYKVELEPTIICIRFFGDTAWDLGWHEFTFTPRSGGSSTTRRFRYLEHWAKSEDGEWRIGMFLNNTDLPPQL